MMSFIRGQVVYQGEGYIVIETNDIGYKITLPQRMDIGDGKVELFIHEAIRENDKELFGFHAIESLELFWKLISVSGIGPKIGQKMVFSHEADHIRSQIMGGNLEFLISMPGIGKKTAQKIILELKGVLAQEPEEVVGDLNADVLDALVSLGYPRSEAMEAIKHIPSETNDAEDAIREALKVLSI